MIKREQLYMSNAFYAEIDQIYLRYKIGELEVPEKFKGRRLTRNLIYLIALDSYFSEKHGVTSCPFEIDD
ncbi:hypothetical protein [Acinetobacter pollinis]|uniref:hypothetical protein n=1 Tax=Acinetobacter pollinis TaxID=2605270 RepID=UPI001BB4504E|nr:hypothetical protein [Acinetobacter pollinis]